MLSITYDSLFGVNIEDRKSSGRNNEQYFSIFSNCGRKFKNANISKVDKRIVGEKIVYSNKRVGITPKKFR